jgi:probable HAF family extracellular repeat protein
MAKRKCLLSGLVWLAFLFVFPFAASRAGAAVMYTVTDLGTLPGSTSSIATGINNKGQVVGYCNTENSSWPYYTSQAFLYYPFGYMQGLGTLPGQSSSLATGINDSGLVVGYCYSGYGNFGGYQAFLSYPGEPMDDLGIVGTLGGSSAQANGINNNNDVVGNYTASTLETRSFFYGRVWLGGGPPRIYKPLGGRAMVRSQMESMTTGRSSGDSSGEASMNTHFSSATDRRWIWEFCPAELEVWQTRSIMPGR